MLLHIGKNGHRLWSRIVLKQSISVTPKLLRHYIKSKVSLDFDFICDPNNTNLIKNLITKRNNNGNIETVIQLYNKLKTSKLKDDELISLKNELEYEALKIPNKVDPKIFEIGEEPRIIEHVNEKPKFNFKPSELIQLANELNVLQTNRLIGLTMGRTTGYFLRGGLAELERAMVKWTISCLRDEGFQLMSVPDIVYKDIVGKCGMPLEDHQIKMFNIANDEEEDICLVGTGEIGIAAYLRDRQFTSNELPLMLATVSRCHRPELVDCKLTNNLYRVQHFNKVEMYIVTADETGTESTQMFQKLINIQRKLFSDLELHFRVVEMPLNGIGDSAFYKIDMEAWMPGKDIFGEISSASNCIDYQSRRLNITYTDPQGKVKFVHTLNGTACATMRCLIALCETHQKEDGSINIPKVIQPYYKKSELNKAKPLRIMDFISFKKLS